MNTKDNNIIYTIDSNILKKYVSAINSIKEPMIKLKKLLKQKNNSTKKNKKTAEQINYIKTLSNIIIDFTNTYPKNRTKIYTDTIKQIIETNNGTITTRMIEPLNISREYLSILENNKEIERASRGVYLLPNSFEDSYYSFQQKYKKTIFSHMNALYFYGMTEEFPYNYTVTVPQNYHADNVNNKCNVFYVADDIYELGVCEIETPSGNKIKTYDIERCICDIIKSKRRMDPEQVKKTIKNYIKRKDKDLNKLSEYSKKLGINKQVLEIVGMFYD